LVVLQLCSGLFARPTTSYEAEEVVRGWLKADRRPLDTTLGRGVMRVETFSDENDVPVYYIVYLQPSGLVIVSADDLVEPIIGFAAEGTYEPGLDNPLGALVTNDLGGRMASVRGTMSSLATVANAAVTETQSKWRDFISLAEAPENVFGLMGLSSLSDVRVEQLVKSKWNQHYVCGRSCYNYYTPNGYHCGCVATAMAQIMRYHEYPKSTGIGRVLFLIEVDGTPEYVYTRGGDGQGGPYKWSQMELQPGCEITLGQRQAIGALCYDAGVAAKTAYSAGSSSSNLQYGANALRDTFKYSNAVKGWNRGNNISGEVLNDMVNPNLDAANPVILGIWRDEEKYGHAVICDGYGYNASTLYHHLNMGWSGVSDSWYNLPTIDSNDSYNSYNAVTECVYNIFTSGSGEIISGRVTNTLGKPISEVRITAEGRGGPYITVTNNKGIYVLMNLKTYSSYIIKVKKSGYNFANQIVKTKKSRDDNTVSGNTWKVDFVGEDWTIPSGSCYLEDFETGDFSKFPWEQDEDASWTTTLSRKHFGSYSAEAGEVSDDGSTLLQVRLDCVSGNISFYRKVSSEFGFDCLEFYIDGVEMDKWSGEEDWVNVSFPVMAGMRTFQWRYSKDYSISEGEDRAWIDDILFPLSYEIKPPDGVTASDGEYFEKVRVSWYVVTEATGYNVYRNTENDTSSASLIGITQDNSISFDDTTANPGTLYWYWVKAMSNGNQSEFSDCDTGWRSFAPADTGS